MKGSSMKFISSKTIKCLMIFAFISSSLPLLAASGKSYDGTVVEFSSVEEGSSYQNSAYLKYPNAIGAWILWVIQPGVFVKEGTKLCTSDTTYIDVNIRICKLKLESQELILKYAKRDMDRQNELAKTKSVSKKTMEDSEVAFYSAQIAYQLASQDLENANWDKKFADLVAPYDCYIDQVFTRPGTISDIDYPVLKIIRLSPLYVEVKLDRDLAKKIYDQKVGVSVYPMGIDKPVGIFNAKAIITDDGIKLPVVNYLLDNPEKLPVIQSLGYAGPFKAGVSPFSTEEVELGILEYLIYKDDDKREYVWKAVGQKALEPGKVIANEFSIEKVYVEKTGVKREGLDGKLYQLKKTDKLQVNDILLAKVSENLKTGDKVMFKRKTTLFWPGDKVKVILSE
jgi:hypothetical protein